jgi:hypothetical protein
MAAARVLQLLRSTTIYDTFELAASALRGLQGRKDGEIVLARYTPVTVNGVTVDTAIGVYHVAGNTTTCTVFQSSTEIAKRLDDIQSELDDTQTGAGLGTDGSYTVPEENEAGFEVLGGQNAPDNLYDAIMKLADEIAGMDYSYNTNASDTTASAAVNDRSKVIASISEVNGDITVGSTAAKDLLLTNYTNDGTTNTGSIVPADTVEKAFNKLENKVGANKITNADGSITVTEPTGSATTTDINVNIKTGEKVLHKDGNEGLWTDIKIQKVIPTGTAGTDEILDTNLGANVREAYRLMSNNGSGTYVQLGKDINVYKDSSLISVQLGTMGDTLTNEDANQKSDVSTIVPGTGDDALVFVYYLGDENKYQRASINVESFLTDSEYGIGLAVESDGAATNSKRVYVKKDTNSEQVITAYSESGNTTADVLTIGNDGVKVANIQAAIDAAVGRAQTTINTTVNKSGETVADPHISIAETTADNGSKSYTFSETDIDSQARAIAAEKVLSDSINGTGSYNETTGVATPYASPANATYANTNNVKGDIAALDAAAADGLNLVTSANKAIVVGAKENKQQELTLTLDTTTQGTGMELTSVDNALTITNAGLFLSNTWDCGTY